MSGDAYHELPTISVCFINTLGRIDLPSCCCFQEHTVQESWSWYWNWLKFTYYFPQNTDANSAAKEVIDMMESYNLTREDWDSVMEIGKWGSEPDITSKIPTKVNSLKPLSKSTGCWMWKFLVLIHGRGPRLFFILQQDFKSRLS